MALPGVLHGLFESKGLRTQTRGGYFRGLTERSTSGIVLVLIQTLTLEDLYGDLGFGVEVSGLVSKGVGIWFSGSWVYLKDEMTLKSRGPIPIYYESLYGI